MSNIKLEITYTGIDTEVLMKQAEKVEKIHEELKENAKKEEEFLGWYTLPSNYDKKEFENIKKCAKN